MSANSDQDDTVSRTSSESARSTPVEDPGLLESSDEDDDDYLPSAPQTDTGNDEDEMEAVDDEVAGDGAQEENTVSVGDGAAGEDDQEEVDELQESGNEEALPEKAETSPGKPTKQALLLKGNERVSTRVFCDGSMRNDAIVYSANTATSLISMYASYRSTRRRLNLSVAACATRGSKRAPASRPSTSSRNTRSRLGLGSRRRRRSGRILLAGTFQSWKGPTRMFVRRRARGVHIRRALARGREEEKRRSRCQLR